MAELTPGQGRRQEELKARLKAARAAREASGSSGPALGFQKLMAAEKRMAQEKAQGVEAGAAASAAGKARAKVNSVIERVDTAGRAAKGAMAGAGVATGAGIVDAIGDPGFVLFIAGLLTFLFNELLANASLSLLLGSVFMFYSALFILKGKGLMVVIVFWAWYVFWGGSVADPLAMLYSLAPFLMVGMLLHGLFTKFSNRGTFLEGASGELIGLVPLLFFFLDLGLIALLTKTFDLPLSTWSQNLVLFTPWWALLGLFTTKKENFLISVAKVIGVLYIFSLLMFGVAPEAYQAYQSAIPGPEEFLQAKQELREQLPQRENPFLSNLLCLGEFQDFPGCVQRRQEESELKSICAPAEKEGTAIFDQCLKEQRERKQGLLVVGISDPTIKKPTRAEFVIGDYFPKTSYRQVGEETKSSYPADLRIENPRKQRLTVEVSCYFQKGTSQERLPGEITGGSQLVVEEESATRTVICQPPADLEGSYRLVFEANLKDLVGVSRLQRAFIGIKASPEREELTADILSAHFPGQNYLSQAPADLARLNFALGNSLENPVVESGQSIVLSSSLENTGRGKITNIKHYRLELEGFTVDNPECLEGFNVAVPGSGSFSRQAIHLPTCFVSRLPPDLENPGEYVFREFQAKIVYDYLIPKEINVEVKVLTT